MALRTASVAALTAGSLLALAGPAQGALPQVPVRATSLVEQAPGTGLAGFAWSQNSAHHRRAANLFVETGNGPAIRVNPPHTVAWPGSIDGTTLIYQQAPTGSNQSDIRLWDINTHTRSTPAGVNTRNWEFNATMSGSWIEFGRYAIQQHRIRVILHNTVPARTSLSRMSLGRSNFGPSWPSQRNWAVWDVCRRVCNVFRYDIANGDNDEAPRTRCADSSSTSRPSPQTARCSSPILVEGAAPIRGSSSSRSEARPRCSSRSERAFELVVTHTGRRRPDQRHRPLLRQVPLRTPNDVDIYKVVIP